MDIESEIPPKIRTTNKKIKRIKKIRVTKVTSATKR